MTWVRRESGLFSLVFFILNLRKCSGTINWKKNSFFPRKLRFSTRGLFLVFQNSSLHDIFWSIILFVFICLIYGSLVGLLPIRAFLHIESRVAENIFVARQLESAWPFLGLGRLEDERHSRESSAERDSCCSQTLRWIALRELDDFCTDVYRCHIWSLWCVSWVLIARSKSSLKVPLREKRPTLGFVQGQSHVAMFQIEFVGLF